jgi:hypothetical protein
VSLEAFATSIVMRVSWPTHTRHYLVLPKYLQVSHAGILYTTIRMVTSPGVGCLLEIACLRAPRGSLACRLRWSAQPTTFPEFCITLPQNIARIPATLVTNLIIPPKIFAGDLTFQSKARYRWGVRKLWRRTPARQFLAHPDFVGY